MKSNFLYFLYFENSWLMVKTLVDRGSFLDYGTIYSKTYHGIKASNFFSKSLCV